MYESIMRYLVECLIKVEVNMSVSLLLDSASRIFLIDRPGEAACVTAVFHVTLEITQHRAAQHRRLQLRCYTVCCMYLFLTECEARVSYKDP